MIQGCEILLKLFNNIINFPDDEKFRVINQQNQHLKTKLFNLKGINEYLFDIGFSQIEENSLAFDSSPLILKRAILYLTKYNNEHGIKSKVVIQHVVETAQNSKETKLEKEKLLKMFQEDRQEKKLEMERTEQINASKKEIKKQSIQPKKKVS